MEPNSCDANLLVSHGQSVFGEEVGIWRSRDKKLAKASDLKGAVGRLLYVDLWGDGACALLKRGCGPDDPEFTWTTT